MPRGHQQVKRNDRLRQTQMDAVLTSLWEGARVMDACKAANISRRVFFEWKQRYPEFAAKCEVAQLSCISVVEDSLYTKAVNGDTTAAIFFLCNRSKDRWGHVANIQHSGPGGNPIQIAAAANVFAAHSDAQLDDIINRSGPVPIPGQPPATENKHGA